MTDSRLKKHLKKMFKKSLSRIRKLVDRVIIKRGDEFYPVSELFKRRRSVYVLKYSPTYNEDGLFTNHNCDFVDEKRFDEAYHLGFETGSTNGWHIRWRVHVACWLADRATKMEGDFVECGTNKGLIARAITHYTNFECLEKKFYLVDTFNGLVDSLLS